MHLPSLHLPAVVRDSYWGAQQKGRRWIVMWNSHCFKEKTQTNSTLSHVSGAALRQHPREAVEPPPSGFWETWSRFEVNLCLGQEVGSRTAGGPCQHRSLREAMLVGLGLMWAVGLHQQPQPARAAPGQCRKHWVCLGQPQDSVGCELGVMGIEGIGEESNHESGFL